MRFTGHKSTTFSDVRNFLISMKNYLLTKQFVNRYRWAFVGSQNDCSVGDAMNNGLQDVQLSSSIFIPHVRRISSLMDLRFTSHSPVCNSNVFGLIVDL